VAQQGALKSEYAFTTNSLKLLAKKTCTLSNSYVFGVFQTEPDVTFSI
jgi:hypothetical protein